MINVDPTVVDLGVGLLSGAVGAYTGLKMGLVKMQVYMDIVRQDVRENQKRILRHSDELLAHDIEIGNVMDKLRMNRHPHERNRMRSASRNQWEEDSGDAST